MTVDSEKLIEWLKVKDIFIIKDGKYYVYGEALDTTEQFKNEHQWEFSRNRMIEKTIKYLEDVMKNK